MKLTIRVFMLLWMTLISVAVAIHSNRLNDAEGVIFNLSERIVHIQSRVANCEAAIPNNSLYFNPEEK